MAAVLFRPQCVKPLNWSPPSFATSCDKDIHISVLFFFCTWYCNTIESSCIHISATFISKQHCNTMRDLQPRLSLLCFEQINSQIHNSKHVVNNNTCGVDFTRFNHHFPHNHLPPYIAEYDQIIKPNYLLKTFSSPWRFIPHTFFGGLRFWIHHTVILGLRYLPIFFFLAFCKWRGSCDGVLFECTPGRKKKKLYWMPISSDKISLCQQSFRVWAQPKRDNVTK